MVVDTIKEKLCINKQVATKKEVIFVEGDMIVPDSKPDVLNTICTSGIVCIYKKEVMDEKIKVEGNINTYITYMADDNQDRVRGVNTNLDISEIINMPNVNSDMECQIDSSIKDIEAKVINERKIGIKATVELDIKVFSKEDIEIINDLVNSEQIKMLKEELTVNSLIGMGETKIYAKDNIQIDNVDNLAEILKANICICNKDVKISYNKVLAKAEAEVKILCLTEDNRINKAVCKIPLIGFIDIQNINESNTCDINYEIRNIILKPNSVEEHSVYIEIEVAVNVIVYEEKRINLIQDLYSPYEMLEFNKKPVRTMIGKTEMKERKEVREKINIEELDNREIIDVDVVPIISKKNINDNKIIYDGELELRFILGNDSQVQTKKAMVPFEHVIENVGDNNNLNINTEIEIANQDFVVQENGDINTNIEMLIDTNMYRSVNLNTIDEIDINGEREEQDYSLIIYIVKKGDTLWDIAKRFGSTIDDIVRTNGIENADIIYPNQKLFIPRYKRMGVSSDKTPMINYA